MSMEWQEANAFLDWVESKEPVLLAQYIKTKCMQDYIDWVWSKIQSEKAPHDFVNDKMHQRFIEEHEDHAHGFGLYCKDQWIETGPYDRGTDRDPSESQHLLA